MEHVELPLELSSGSTTTRQSSLVNGGEKAKDAEEEEEEVQQVSERAPTLPSRTTSAPRIRVTPQQRQGLHVPAAEEEGRGKRRTQARNRLTYEALGKPAKSALAGAALIVGDDEESDHEECAFAFFTPVEMPGEPATLKEALESSDAEEWKKAMESELKSIEENGMWELVELPEGRKAITSKLVAKGYQQKEKVDYKELFAPVVKPTTLRTLLAGATIKGWVVKQMDVTTTFLNGILEEEIFMAQPEGFDDGSGRVWNLKKALYGLKQTPRQWYLKLREFLEEIGFTPSSANHSLFMLGEGEQMSFMVVYVDDILIFSPSSDLVKEVMQKLQDKFKCKALGDVSFYLGLHIERDVEKRCTRVHQRKYLEALAANFGQSEVHVATPFPSGFKCVKGPEEESVGEEERHRFHSLVGSLMYAAVNTRPDVVFATGQLARVVQCPNEEQVAAGMRVAKYLGQTPTVGLQYSAAAQRRQKGAHGVEPGRFFLTAFSDASYASEPEDMTSVGGFICCVGGGPTAWESKKQVDQALSSVESEHMALFRAVREIVWQRRLLAELGEEKQGPTPLYCDSQGVIALAKNPVLHGLTKHMRSSLLALADPESDSLRAASPTVTCLLATVVLDPSFESTAASALVAELVDFAAHSRLDYTAGLVAESASVCPPSVGGKCALSTDVLEDRHEEFQCFAATLPHLVSMLLAPEGDLDAPDIPTPRSYAEAIEGPYSSQWQTAMDAEMASWKSTSTYVDEVRPPGANIVDGMWILRGVDYFQTFSPTSNMTTLRVLLHVAAQRDYELHSLDFSTAFLEGSLHKEIWLRRPPGFTRSFPAGTQRSLRRPVYGLRQAPREWHGTLRTTLADSSLFLRTDTTMPPFYILVYVDDLVFSTADTAGLAHVKSELHKRHTCTDLSELRSYLGLHITPDRARHTITLTQSHMVQQVLQRFNFTYFSPQATPLSTCHSLSALPSDESVEPSGPYPELVGCLMYLMTYTRPDLAYPLSILAHYVAPGRH
ncbi:unnamed protein product [Closterium sp. NIES-53]